VKIWKTRRKKEKCETGSWSYLRRSSWRFLTRHIQFWLGKMKKFQSWKRCTQSIL